MQNEPTYTWYDFIPIAGLIPNIKRNYNVNPKPLKLPNKVKAFTYISYHGVLLADLIIETTGHSQGLGLLKLLQ